MSTVSGSDATSPALNSKETVAPSSRAGVSFVGAEYIGSFFAERGESTFPRCLTTKEKLFQKFGCSSAVLSQAVAGVPGGDVG